MRKKRRVWDDEKPSARSALRKTGRFGLKFARWISSPVRSLVADVRESVHTERALRPVPIGQPRKRTARAWTYATVGVAVLIVLAFFNNREFFASAVIAALALGLMYVCWMLYRGIVSLLIVLVLWGAGGPLAAFITTEISAPGDFSAHLTSTMPLFWSTGAAVWLAAVLLRVRRPWMMLLASWALALVTIMLVAIVSKDFAYYAAWLVLAVYVLWRGGWLLAAADQFTGRAKVGADYEEATEGQYALYRDLAKLGQGFERFVQVKIAEPDKRATESDGDSEGEKEAKVPEKADPVENGTSQALDALIAGPTGLFYLAVLEAGNDITVSAGRPRRVLVEGKPADDQLRVIAQNARALAAATELEVVTLVMVHEGKLPNRGLLATQSRADGVVVEMTLLHADLIARRIKFGPPVYTVGQLRRIVHRLRKTVVSADADLTTSKKNEKTTKSAVKAS
ncbi:MAG: hypothetical protein HOQ05_00810 [Corynebacteriales bacterium]|nr:hypothetical protein [Mycobacteriales bacterium]